ncbi:hypothetical protein B0H14DRAFT_2586264 [Mycena olivaceomarginata]|nr:hypothetical protein B0H14DRAFT_2586264 [Mycena olivaceomarginata]
MYLCTRAGTDGRESIPVLVPDIELGIAPVNHKRSRRFGDGDKGGESSEVLKTLDGDFFRHAEPTRNSPTRTPEEIPASSQIVSDSSSSTAMSYWITFGNVRCDDGQERSLGISDGGSREDSRDPGRIQDGGCKQWTEAEKTKFFKWFLGDDEEGKANAQFEQHKKNPQRVYKWVCLLLAFFFGRNLLL